LNVQFRRSFVKDLERLRDKALKERVKEAIEQVEAAQSIRDIGNLKKLQGGDRFYRIRIGTYRVGLTVVGGTVTFVRFLHRRELYRYFP